MPAPSKSLAMMLHALAGAALPPRILILRLFVILVAFLLCACGEELSYEKPPKMFVPQTPSAPVLTITQVPSINDDSSTTIAGIVQNVAQPAQFQV